MSKSMMMFDVKFIGAGLEKGVAVFNDNGGYVDMTHSGHHTFNTTDVKDKENFLVVFLGTTLDNVYGIITENGRAARFYPEMLEPNDDSTDVFIYDDGTIRQVFNSEKTTFDDIAQFSDNHGITPHHFVQHVTTGKQYFYSTNPAIQEILEYNNVSPEQLNKRRLKEALHRSLLKGKQEIPDEYRGTYWNVFLSGKKTLMRQKSNSSKSNPPLVLHIPK